MNTKAEVITSLETSLSNSRRDFDMISNALLGQGHIVVCGELALNFKIEGNQVVSTAGHAPAGRVIRFDRETAERIAATVTNGRGDKGKAVHVSDAIQSEIARLEETVSFLKTC